jgi:hypothetical protein
MTNPSLSETLQKMASEDEGLSEAARLRAVYADVERALGRGVPRKAVLAALHADGFTMSLKMFDKEMYRIRSRNRKAGTTTAPTKHAAPLKNGTAEPIVPRPVTPSDIRKIREETDDEMQRLSQPVKRQK